jgi:hypothetical protein
MARRRTWLKYKSHKPVCYPGDTNDCYRPHFVTTQGMAPDLQEATQEINGIFDRLLEDNPHLEILDVGGWLALMDVEHVDDPADDAVRAQDDPERILATLGVTPQAVA